METKTKRSPKSKSSDLPNDRSDYGMPKEDTAKTPDNLLQMAAASAVAKAMFANIERASDPEVSEKGVIIMGLMKGGKIEVSEPDGSHIMRAAKEMAIREDKGSDMQAIYTMVAASRIYGTTDTEGKVIEAWVPMEMHHIQEKLSARDLMVLTNYFQRINLF